MILYNPTVSGSLLITGSLTTTGTLTAQTLVVQTITSSVDFVTGSSVNGSLSSNTHQFTGSVLMTGSLSVVTTGTEFQVNAGGVNIGNALTDSHIISGSVLMTGSLTVGGAAAFSRNINGTGEGTFMGLDAQAVPRLGFVKIAGAQPFLGFGADTFTIRVSNGSTIATSSVFTTALAITTAGVLELPYGQLKFPSSQNASADANTLDDYEEGTWTPTITSGGFSISSISLANYTKVGRVVQCIADFTLSGTGTSSPFYIGGLPFTNLLNGWSASAGYFQFINTDNKQLVAVVMSSATTIQFTLSPASNVGGNTRAANGSDFGAGYMNVNVTYFV